MMRWDEIYGFMNIHLLESGGQISLVPAGCGQHGVNIDSPCVGQLGSIMIYWRVSRVPPQSFPRLLSCSIANVKKIL